MYSELSGPRASCASHRNTCSRLSAALKRDEACKAKMGRVTMSNDLCRSAAQDLPAGHWPEDVPEAAQYAAAHE